MEVRLKKALLVTKRSGDVPEQQLCEGSGGNEVRVQVELCSHKPQRKGPPDRSRESPLGRATWGAWKKEQVWDRRGSGEQPGPGRRVHGQSCAGAGGELCSPVTHGECPLHLAPSTPSPLCLSLQASSLCLALYPRAGSQGPGAQTPGPCHPQSHFKTKSSMSLP